MSIDWVFDIECCTGCSTHQNISRHSERLYQETYSQIRDELRRLSISSRKNKIPDYLIPVSTNHPTHLYRNKVNGQPKMFPSCGSFEIRFRNVLLYSKLQLERFPTVDDVATLLSIVRQEAKHDESLKPLQKYSMRVQLQTNSMFEPKTCLYQEFLQYQQRLMTNLIKLQTHRPMPVSTKSNIGDTSKQFRKRKKNSTSNGISHHQANLSKKSIDRNQSLNRSTLTKDISKDLENIQNSPSTNHIDKISNVTRLSQTNREILPCPDSNESFRGKLRTSTRNPVITDIKNNSFTTSNDVQKADVESTTERMDLSDIHKQMLPCHNVEPVNNTTLGESHKFSSNHEREQKLSQQEEVNEILITQIQEDLSEKFQKNKMRYRMTIESSLQQVKQEADSQLQHQTVNNTSRDANRTHLQAIDGQDNNKKQQVILQEENDCQSGDKQTLLTQLIAQLAEDNKTHLLEGQNSEVVKIQRYESDVRVENDEQIITNEFPEETIIVGVRKFLSRLRTTVTINLQDTIFEVGTEKQQTREELLNCEQQDGSSYVHPIQKWSCIVDNAHTMAQSIQYWVEFSTNKPIHIQYSVQFECFSNIVTQIQRKVEDNQLNKSFIPQKEKMVSNIRQGCQFPALIKQNFSQPKNFPNYQPIIDHNHHKYLFSELTQHCILRSAREFYNFKYTLFPKDFMRKDNSWIQTPTQSKKLQTVLQMIRSKHPRYISRLFESGQSVNPGGQYCIWLCDSTWKPVYVDDTFAFSEGKPIYTDGDGSLWLMLLEKAIAQTIGGYHRIQNIDFGRLFRMLTGTPTVSVKLSNKKASDKLLRQDTLLEEGAYLYVSSSTSDLSHQIVQISKGEQQELLLRDIQNNESKLRNSQLTKIFDTVTLIHFHPEYLFNQTLLHPSAKAAHEVDFDSYGNGLCFILFIHRFSQEKVKVSLFSKRPGKGNNTERKSLVGQVNRSGSFFFSVDLKQGRYCLIINSDQTEEPCIAFYSHQTITIVQQQQSQIKQGDVQSVLAKTTYDTEQIHIRIKTQQFRNELNILTSDIQSS